MADIEQQKQQAAEQALSYVRDGMVLGLGSGSTATYMLIGLGERLRDGRLRDISGAPTSEETAALARKQGIPLVTLDQQPQLDLALDGADEVDPDLNLIKGLGGALLREKIVASCASQFVVFADDRKQVPVLGTRSPLPVEIVPFAQTPVTRRLAALGCEPVVRRRADGSTLITDEGNLILDCHFDTIPDPHALDAAIHTIPGVVEHGLFLGMATLVLLAGANGVTTLRRS